MNLGEKLSREKKEKQLFYCLWTDERFEFTDWKSLLTAELSDGLNISVEYFLMPSFRDKL